jgi:hypothetical protein
MDESPIPAARRGGARVEDVADRMHHGATRAEIQAESRRKARESIQSMLAAHESRRTKDGVLTSQPDYELRRQEFDRELLLRGRANGRLPEYSSYGSAAAGAPGGSGVMPVDAAAARQQHPSMFPAPASVRNRRPYAPSQAAAPPKSYFSRPMTSTTDDENHPGRRAPRTSLAALRDLARQQASQTAPGRRGGGNPLLVWFKTTLGSTERFKKLITVVLILFLLNARRIYNIFTTDDDWEDAIMGNTRPRDESGRQRTGGVTTRDEVEGSTPHAKASASAEAQDASVTVDSAPDGDPSFERGDL